MIQKNSIKKFGLIIQGPLVSVGRSGRNAHVPKTTLEKQGDFVNYDCRENIRRVIKDFGNIFDSIVISTWENDVRPDDTWQGATLVASPDPGDIKRKNYTYRSLNKHRQFISMRAGLKEIKKNKSIEYVVKIRTDQYLGLSVLIDSFLDNVNRAGTDAHIIGVPLTLPDDFMTHDLYFAAKVDTVDKFCDAVLAFNAYEFIPCIHRDMLLKHAYVHYRNEIGVPLPAYFPFWPPLGASAETKKVFAYMYKHVFIPLNDRVYKTVVARGTLQSQEHIEEYIHPSDPDKTPAMVKNIFNLPMLISTNWKQYFDFLKNTEGRAVTFRDQILIRAGKLGWKLTNQLRVIAQKTKMVHVFKKAYRLKGLRIS